MLKPTFNYVDKIESKFGDELYTERFYYASPECDTLPNVEPTDYRQQWISVDKHDNILGYFAYYLKDNCADRFMMYSFSKDHTIFAHDVARKIKELIATCRRVEFHCIGSNPVLKHYKNLSERYDGRYVVLHEVIPCYSGKGYEDDYIFEFVKSRRPQIKRNIGPRKKFRIEDYPGEYAMHCDTEGKARVFCKYLDDIGRTWCAGDSYTKYNHWCVGCSQTVYYFNEGQFDSASSALINGYKILEFDDFNWDTSNRDASKPNNRKFRIEDYPGNYVMYCGTEEKSRIFCKYLDSVGKRWCSGCSYLNRTNWDNSNDIVYYFNEDAYSKICEVGHEYQILKFDDFDWDISNNNASKQSNLKFHIEDYTGQYVMHCDTKEKAETFCKYLDSVGRKWASGDRYTYTYWNMLEIETVYYFNEGKFDDESSARNSGYAVLEFDDFEWDCPDADANFEKPMFHIKDYPGKYAMHCDTEEKAKLFCNYLHRMGKHWIDKTDYTDTVWNELHQGMVYEFNDDMFSHIDYARHNGYTILEFDDFDWSVDEKFQDSKPLKRKFNIEDYPNNYYMHCDTIESARVFSEYMNYIGKRWKDGGQYSSEFTLWEVFRKDTVYDFNACTFTSINLLNKFATVLEFQDFDWSM